MDRDLKKILSNNGYVTFERPNFLLIKRKIVKSVRLMLAFLVPGILMIISGAYLAQYLNNTGLGLLIFVAGALICNIPFIKYLTSPYKSLLIDKAERTLLFRSRFSRAYQFSEIVELNIRMIDSYSNDQDRKRRRSKNTYSVEIQFVHNIKEELFRISCDANLDAEYILQISDYFEKDVFRIEP